MMTSPRPGALCLALALGLASILGAACARASPAPCRFVSVGLDTTHYNTAVAPFLGKALGQTFYAPETLVAKITIWRPPNDRRGIGAHLYVTNVDTTYSPPYPLTREILLDGPTVLVYDSDPPGQFIAMPFVLDPPLALPRRGMFAWFLQTAYCDPGADWYLSADSAAGGGYARGAGWITGRAISSCHLAYPEGEEPLDFLFEVEFCDMTTPTRRSTWGRLKILYR